MLIVKLLRSRAAYAVLLLSFVLLSLAPVYAASDVVISQVYGGGGNSGATYKNDFIELFNRGTAPVNVTGWSVQYASATGSTWAKTALSGTILPGHYYLVQEAVGGGGTVNLPTPDATGTIAMAAGAGKVALVSNSTPLTGACPNDQAVDFVGFGSAATCFEGSAPTPTLTNTTAALRSGNGCADNDSNSTDFATGAANPRNSASATNSCAASTNPSATNATATPSTVEAGHATLLLLTINPGANPASTGLAATADLSSLGGSATQILYNDGSNGDITADDGVHSLNFTVPAGVAPNTYVLPISIRDAQLRTGSGSISLTVVAPAIPVTIHEIQGSGALSPLTDQRVSFTGIVTAVANNGFYVEAPDDQQDNDPNTSEGVFVYSGSAPSVHVADDVQVSGKVSEYGAPMPVTEIATPTYSVRSSGNALPTVVDIAPDPAGTLDQLERYEGMLVRLLNPHVVGPTGGSTSSNGIFYVTSGTVPRPFREPGLEPGIAPTLRVADALDFDGNPERVRVDTAASGVPVSVGTRDPIPNIVGPLGYSTDYTIYPDASFTATSTMTAVPLPDPGDREFTVASFNMLNFTSATNRINKASLAIRDIMRLADIIGVEEVNTLATLQALAAKINADAQANGQGNPGYTAELKALSGSQNVGFLYRTDRVTDVTVEQVGDGDHMPGTLLPLNDRPPLVMTAKLLPPVGQPFPVTVIVNHLRSLIDVDTDSSTGVFARSKRQLGSEYLANLIAQHQLAGEHVISVGDYNAFEFSDGLVDVLGTVKGAPAPFGQVLLSSYDLVDPDLVDMAYTVAPELRYSYVENGNAQTLDHIVVTGDLLTRPYHLEIAHNNAEFPGTFAGDATRPERVSDHDMPVGYFTFPPLAADLSVTMTGSANVVSGTVQQFTIQIHNAGPDAATNVSLTDTLPAHTTFRSVTSPAGWTCTTPAVGSSGAVQCSTASVASGTDAQFTLQVMADCATANGVQLLNAASVSSSTGDPIATNNNATHQVLVSNPPPQITGLTVDTPVLWSPNHTMVSVMLNYVTTDNCDESLLPAIAVKSSQSVTAAGPHANDWEVVDSNHVLLRAERTPPGDRVYTLSVTVTDSAGSPTVASIDVVVPQSQRR